MKSKLAAAIETIRLHCKRNHYRCCVCPLQGGGKCGLATEPHKWKAVAVHPGNPAPERQQKKEAGG